MKVMFTDDETETLEVYARIFKSHNFDVVTFDDAVEAIEYQKSQPADVIIADGFSGNISLKTAEGTALLVTSYLKKALKSSLSSKIGYLFAKKAINNFRLQMDPRKYNGAVFLGLNGIAVKSHGGTDAFGFANAIGVAVDMVRYNFISDLKNKISKIEYRL